MHGGNVWQGGAPGRWLDYSANIRPEGAPQWVRDALRGAMENVSFYPELSMSRARAALGQVLGLPADWALPTAGGIAAIGLAARLEATEALVCAPCFGEYASQLALAGRKARFVSLLSGPHRLGDPAAQLEKTLRERGAVWLCNPLNPVGAAFSRAQLMSLLELVEARRGWLIVDEAFIEYCPGRTAVPLLAEHERLLIAGSMTKILGIPGVRLGYLCAQPRMLAELAHGQPPWELNCFAETVLRALPDHRAELRGYAAENAARRERLRAALRGLGAFVYPSEAAFLLADFGRPVAPLAAALKAKGILVRECPDFAGIDDGRHLRLAVKTDAENERLIQALREAMGCAENP